MIYNKENFEHQLFEELKSTDELMKDWETDPYYMDAGVCNRFWNEVKKAPKVAIVGDYDVDVSVEPTLWARA